MEGGNCRLLDLENWLLGLPSYYRSFFTQFKKINVCTFFMYFCTRAISKFYFNKIQYQFNIVRFFYKIAQGFLIDVWFTKFRKFLTFLIIFIMLDRSIKLPNDWSRLQYIMQHVIKYTNKTSACWYVLFMKEKVFYICKIDINLYLLFVLQTCELIDVYCFGQLLYEVAFGKQLLAPTCDSLPPSSPPEISEL